MILQFHRVPGVGIANFARRYRNPRPFGCVSGFRFASTGKSSADDNETQETPSFAEISLRSVGQVVFCNSPKSGLAILGGLAIGDPYLAGLAAAGTISAIGAAKISRLDKETLNNGLWGYNGCLVGCAVAVFLHPLPVLLDSTMLTSTASLGLVASTIGGAATPFASASLKPAMGTVPQWTLAFNFVTLSMLLRTRPFAGPALDVPSVMFDPLVALHAPLNGVSQIFVVESSLSGAVLLGGIGLYSPGLAAHAFLGSSVGAATGVLLGADVHEIAMGLWGFNSALTSLGVGVFFCHSKESMALSSFGAAATAILFGGLKTVFGSWDSPCLTLPFCITMSGCFLLKDAIPGLLVAHSPHSPEKNVPMT